MAKKIKGNQVFTGQLLRDGDVVFLADNGEWTKNLQQAVIATDAEQVAALEVIAESGVDGNVVIDIYPFVVDRDESGKLVPSHIRERVRTEGPSINYIAG